MQNETTTVERRNLRLFYVKGRVIQEVCSYFHTCLKRLILQPEIDPGRRFCVLLSKVLFAPVLDVVLWARWNDRCVAEEEVADVSGLAMKFASSRREYVVGERT